jgi:DNA-binding transcriptional LysR family regulator
MLPDLDSLRCFVAAATHLRFRAAANSVHLSPTAFSERIRRLEQDLGLALFERTTRRVRLTRDGARLLPQALRALEEVSRFQRAAAETAGPERFDLVIGTRFELGLSWIVPSLAALERRRPERTLHLSFGDSPDLLARTERGSIDAVITSERLRSVSFEHVDLHEERYAFVGAPRLLRDKPIRSAGDAGEHVLLDIHADLPLFRYFRDAGPPDEVWAFRTLRRLGTIGAVSYVAQAGGGVAVLPRYLIADDLRARRLREILPARLLQRDFFRLVWPRGHAREAELRALAQELRRIPLR